jgi:leucyl-tRNA synthetase
MKYIFRNIEAKWQEYWAKHKTFRASDSSDKPKYYVLDMFPYPSGAGLHVGHPLGYIASDIYARYKRHKGYNVLHPMGYDSFGLPAEQYAIQTGQHPALTTEANISRYREQLDRLGFSFDWSREVRTSDPAYYKWTQWVFIQLFNSWYNKDTDRAEPVSNLVKHFEAGGNINVNAACDEDTPAFTAPEWKKYSEREQQQLLLKYRLTYLADTEVNWCPALGTVLANDEIVNGVSERGGHPVVRKKMTQWSMRITAYAQRLLDGLATIDWPQPLKDAQVNWIGRSEGALVSFKVLAAPHFPADLKNPEIKVFTTRPDTIFGASFMTLAPEHELVEKITSPEQRETVEAYVKATSKRSERDRLADVKSISGAFTGAYAEHPFTQEAIPIWIGDYVLAGYGTGAVMSVPCGDQRDHDFARHFNIPIPNIFAGVDVSEEAFADKEQTVIANSDFLDGLAYKDAVKKVIGELEALGQGVGKVNYRLRDAVFSRQRYWGEPFPVYYEDGLPRMIAEEHLPLQLPEVEKYLPTETGEPPLGNATVWAWDRKNAKVVANEFIDHKEVFPLELNTMPGWAGSSQYFNRYMDPGNQEAIFSQEAVNYWQDVDLYIGGMEHATGHLLYSRFWQKFMYDRGWVPKQEYARKLINQGMILGTSAFIYRLMLPSGKTLFISRNLFEGETIKGGLLQQLLGDTGEDLGIVATQSYAVVPLHVDVSLVNASDELDIDRFRNYPLYQEYGEAIFVYEDDKYVVGREVEKMSKSKYNVVNPDAICDTYGADSLRLYEMFLGPLEQAKPWNTAGITGVHSFLKKLWKLYHSGEDGAFVLNEEAPSAEAFKILHKTIRKVEEDIEVFSFNTTVSTFMICVNELNAMKCRSKAILEPLAILISPYAPHIAEELWEKMGNPPSVSEAPFPEFQARYLVEDQKEYPISFNGKMRFTLALPLDLGKDAIEEAVMAHDKTRQQLDGRSPKKVIVVPGKIVNIVV